MKLQETFQAPVPSTQPLLQMNRIAGSIGEIRLSPRSVPILDLCEPDPSIPH